MNWIDTLSTKQINRISGEWNAQDISSIGNGSISASEKGCENLMIVLLRINAPSAIPTNNEDAKPWRVSDKGIDEALRRSISTRRICH